jgi:pimeloyl-ACP methyl ester carboxylesterase
LLRQAIRLRRTESIVLPLASRPLRRWLTLSLMLLPMVSVAQAQGLRHRELVHKDGVLIDVIVEGSGPAIVLLPSSQRDSEDFDAVATRIAAAGFLVLRPQPRGIGRSSGPMQDLTLNVLAGDVALVVEQLGHGRAVLVGHAFGQFVARVVDLDRPELVRGLVVAAAAARVFPAGMTESLAIASDPVQPQAERLKQLRIGFFAPASDPSVWLAGWHPEVRAAYRNAGSTPRKELWWPVSHAPILDLQGADDPWRPRDTRDELKDVLGEKVTVQVIAQASHALFPEQPAAVADAVVAWVRTLPP